MGFDPTLRFSNRVEHYERHRPGYPDEVLDLLAERCRLWPRSVVADVGSGTGLLTELLLRSGATVHAVEPNREMREAGERRLSGHPGFRSVDGRAEATTLETGSVDLVAAGQAFHWFDPEPTRAEFRRILSPGGWVALVWNQRRRSGTPFLDAYERLLLAYAPEYPAVEHRRVDPDVFDGFFGAGAYEAARFDNRQALDREGIEGRLLSSSYVPAAGQGGHEEMLAELGSLFDAHSVDGRVVLEYDTLLYTGRLA